MKDFQEIDFLVYHSGFKSAAGIDHNFTKTGEIPRTTEFCRMGQTQQGISTSICNWDSRLASL